MGLVSKSVGRWGPFLANGAQHNLLFVMFCVDCIYVFIYYVITLLLCLFAFAFSTRHVFGVLELRNARLMEHFDFSS